MDKIVMIVAGGTGTRMNAGIPKQFVLLDKRPVLMHTVEVFRKYDIHIRIIVVLPEDQIGIWKGLCNQYNFAVEHEIGSGGETRFHSVKRNLSSVPDNCLVGIHDGVRPLVSLETIERCYAAALKNGNAIPTIKIPETLRRIEGAKSVQVDRELYCLIQTPQVFMGNILKKAYRQDYREEFTDDAGVIESAGYAIYLVDGNPENIKITYKNDLKTAAALISP
ncbi:MAG TPA: 2-C-methyl-D-erythritol 4-phosphate cytidylyltransferase [Bacteroidales bacterium]|jgi:2-C-methyl-D-erythritol 4-phosphate cytidylyltransferase|nr:2-C-methyl-D-erythritol 4-phosphate cytidylyltransferase [Bacteroidales bacterium]